MIRKIAIQNFKMLRDCAVDLARMQLVVGPCACGKSTLLDAVHFVSDVVAHGVCKAVASRASRLEELSFDPQRPITIALEILPAQTPAPCARYELEVGRDPHADGAARVVREQVFIVGRPELFAEPPPLQPSLFGTEPGETSLLHDKTPRGWRKAVAKSHEGKDSFWDEKTDGHNMFRFGADRSALGSLPEDNDRFPASIALREQLRAGVRPIQLRDRALREPSGPRGARRIQNDGAGLPLAVRALHDTDPARFSAWLERVRLVTPGLVAIGTRERQDDRFTLLEARFEGRDGVVPQWLLSSETLRVMALALLMDDATDGSAPILLLDQPESGLGPRSIHVLFDLLASVERGQVLCATSSPQLASRGAGEQVIVLRRAADGSACAACGTEVPDKPSWFEP